MFAWSPTNLKMKGLPPETLSPFFIPNVLSVSWIFSFCLRFAASALYFFQIFSNRSTLAITRGRLSLCKYFLHIPGADTSAMVSSTWFDTHGIKRTRRTRHGGTAQGGEQRRIWRQILCNSGGALYVATLGIPLVCKTRNFTVTCHVTIRNSLIHSVAKLFQLLGDGKGLLTHQQLHFVFMNEILTTCFDLVGNFDFETESYGEVYEMKRLTLL